MSNIPFKTYVEINDAAGAGPGAPSPCCVPQGGTLGQVLIVGVDNARIWASQPQDFSFFVATLIASSVVFQVTAQRQLIFAANSLGLILDVAATALQIYTVNRNGSSIGSITVNAGETIGITAIAAFNLALHDDLRIVAPAAVDATAAGCRSFGTATR